MKKSAMLVVGLVIVLGAVVGGYVLMRDTSTDSGGATGDTITYTDSGFSPATLRVKSGTTITVKNESSKELDFKSDPHPVHTTNSELNQEDLPAGESQTFTVTEKGTWGYHDHHDPDKTGTIIVE